MSFKERSPLYTLNRGYFAKFKGKAVVRMSSFVKTPLAWNRFCFCWFRIQFEVAFSLTVGLKLIQFDIFVIIFPTNIWQPCTNIHIKLANLTQALHQFIAEFERRKKFLVQKYMKIWRYIDCCSEMSQTGQIKVSGQGGRHLMYYPWKSHFPLLYKYLYLPIICHFWKSDFLISSFNLDNKFKSFKNAFKSDDLTEKKFQALWYWQSIETFFWVWECLNFQSILAKFETAINQAKSLVENE